MKYHLKNRPAVHIFGTNRNLSKEFYIDVCKDWEKWFEGIEKELRERMKETQLPSGGYVEIREILGEK